MHNTAEFLDMLRLKLGLKSDGELARYLGMQRQHVSKYRTGGHTFDDAVSIKVAAILDIDSSYVLACMHYQRAKLPEIRAAWMRSADLAKHAMKAAAFAFVVFTALPLLDSHHAAFALAMSPVYSDSLYIMSSYHGHPFAVFMLLFSLCFFSLTLPKNPGHFATV